MSGLRNIARSAFAAIVLAAAPHAWGQPADLGLTASPDAGETMDRYGGGPGTSPSPIAPRQDPQPTRFLDWTGKTSPSAAGFVSANPAARAPVTPPFPSAPTLRSAPVSAESAAPRPPQSIYDPRAVMPSAALSSVAGSSAAGSSVAGSSVALPGPPKPASMATQKAPGGPRFYSMHRDYGLQPDAIPLPPQFFGPTADLSTPVSDPSVRRVLGADGQMHTVQTPPDVQGSP